MKVTQTRLIGQTQHKSGHPLAPMDYVYEIEEPKRPDSSRYFSEEWSAPNLWVTIGLYAFFIIPVWTLGLWLVFN